MLRSDNNTAKSLLLFSTFPNEHLCSNERKIRNFSKWITDQKKLISPEKKIEGEIEDEKSRNFGECNVTVHNSHFTLFLFGVISSCSRSKNYSSFTLICNSWSLIFLNLFFKRFLQPYCWQGLGLVWGWSSRSSTSSSPLSSSPRMTLPSPAASSSDAARRNGVTWLDFVCQLPLNTVSERLSRIYFPNWCVQFGWFCRLFFAYFAFSLIYKGFNIGQENPPILAKF